MFISSNISIANRIEEPMLGFFNGRYISRHLGCVGPYVAPIETQVFSRCVGLFISPGALIDAAAHLAILPFTVIYAIGKSLYYWQIDFMLPLQHFQRIRDAVFPIFFGSLLALIHPYLGVYAAEPTKKHIAVGILLSGTEKDNFDSVCSPLTTLDEIYSLTTSLKGDLALSSKTKKMIKDVYFWESEFEKIQSIDFFSLNLTVSLSEKIQHLIQKSAMPPWAKEIVLRISLATYPFFALADLAVYIFAMTIPIVAISLKLVGGQSPAYLEAASSPEVLLYCIIKIPLFIMSVSVGFLVSIVHPKIGLKSASYPMHWLAKIPFLIKMLGIRWRLYWMKQGDSFLLPAVETYPMDERGELALLPSYGSHMRYLLVEKMDGQNLEVEMIERGRRHKKTVPLSEKDTFGLLKDTLSLRYNFHHKSRDEMNEVLHQYDQDPGTELGTQIGLNNCGITNLFAAIEVLRNKEGKDDFGELCTEVKTLALRHYFMYAYDYYPFGKTKEVLEEINNIFHNSI